MSENPSSPPSEPREPRRELEWQEVHVDPPFLTEWTAGNWLVRYGFQNCWTLYLRGEADEAPDDSDYTIPFAFVESSDAAKELANRLQRVLDGEPKLSQIVAALNAEIDRKKTWDMESEAWYTEGLNFALQLIDVKTEHFMSGTDDE